MPRHVIITGASQGIGRALAEKFLKNSDKVLMIARTLADLKIVKREFSDRSYIMATDVTDPKSIIKVRRFINSHFNKQLDILINAAGILGPIGFFKENDLKAWKEGLEINLLGAVYMTYAVLPFMGQKRRGKIINFSGGGAASPRPFFSAYGVSKTALVRFTEVVAEECRLKGLKIDINAVAPGAINTRLLDQALSAGRKEVGSEEYKKLLQQKASGGGSMADAVELCFLLTSSKLDRFSGRLISAIWDDWHNLPELKNKIMASEAYTLRRVKF